ncbi:hypothetical protein [Hathewaya massiliensis]|uniref:hypothetical protein n=1 Tax=Hathewaya massiliensis TaxID=1964382 RepID=UPI001159A950|nr:hypothetical protein [Hathewaya massiliensis]
METAIKKNSQRMISFFKFGKKKHLESLKSGKLYMRNLQHFIDYEEKNKTKGRGDSNEAALIINDATIKFKDPLTGKEIVTAKSKRAIARNTEDLSTPVFCMTCITEDNLKKYDENKYILEFTDIQKEEIIKEFGEYALHISPGDFLNRIDEAFKKQNIKHEARCVEYTDMNQNHSDRIYGFPTNNRFFYKDKKTYEYQQEHRIIILNRHIDDPEENLTIDIGDISEFSCLMETKQLLENGLLVEFISNKR